MDRSSAELWHTKGGWPYRNQNQPLLQEITVPAVLGGSTLERTYRQRIAAEDQLMNVPWKRSPAESTSVRGEESTNAPGDEMTSELRKRQCGYPDKWQRAHMEKERKAYLEESQRAIGDDECTEHRADVKCNYKCTDEEDDQCDCKSTGEMMRRSSEFDLCRTSAFMYTEAVPNETENDLLTYQIVYRTASPVTVTERHRERHSPNGIMRDSWNNYRETMTEHSDQDHCRMTSNSDWIRG